MLWWRARYICVVFFFIHSFIRSLVRWFVHFLSSSFYEWFLNHFESIKARKRRFEMLLQFSVGKRNRVTALKPQHERNERVSCTASGIKHNKNRLFFMIMGPTQSVGLFDCSWLLRFDMHSHMRQQSLIQPTKRSSTATLNEALSLSCVYIIRFTGWRWAFSLSREMLFSSLDLHIFWIPEFVCVCVCVSSLRFIWSVDIRFWGKRVR